MTTYETLSLIISSFAAIGTCGASILALYFWFNDKSIKLNIRTMHADAYGGLDSVVGGYFVVIITNGNYLPIRLESAGIKADQKSWFKKPFVLIYMFENTIFGKLPSRLEYGETYVYARPILEIRSFMQSDLSDDDIRNITDLKLFVCVSTARRDIYYKLDAKSKIEILKK